MQPLPGLSNQVRSFSTAASVSEATITPRIGGAPARNFSAACIFVRIYRVELRRVNLDRSCAEQRTAVIVC